MDPRGIYKQNRQTAWTRVDMLLELYRTALRHTDAAIQLLQAGRRPEARLELLKGARVVGGLKAGLDLSRGDIPRRMDQLFDYALDCFADGELSRVASARRILQNLRQAFEEIRPEAIALEKSGEIPPLARDGVMAVMA
jgi:flagellin-specific chaperone FliS